MLSTETNVERLFQRCDEFERRIAALENTNVVAKTAHNTGSPKLLDELRLIIVHARVTTTEGYKRSLEIIEQLRAGA